jgi:hypothetical protein
MSVKKVTDLGAPRPGELGRLSWRDQVARTTVRPGCWEQLLSGAPQTAGETLGDEISTSVSMRHSCRRCGPVVLV